MAELGREEIRNIFQGEILEYQKQITQVGCQTLVGCGKTKELEGRYGKIESDLHDLSTAMKKVLDITEGMKKEISGVRNLVQIDEKDMGEKMEKIGAKIKKENRALIYAGLGLIVTLLGAKLFQDWKNQEQMVSFLKPMLETIAVLQDHDKIYQEHIKKSGGN